MFIELHTAAISVLIKIISTAAVSAVAFAGVPFTEFIKRTVMTLCVSFVFSGAMIAVYQLFHPPQMLIVNDIVYFDVDPLLLLALTGIIYIMICVTERVMRERIKGSVVRLSFTLGGRSYACLGKIDTGCSIREPFSGDPVIIADLSILPALPDDTARRVIPYRTVAASSLLYAARASSVQIDSKPIDKTVYIAPGSVRHSAYQAIINSEIVR